MTSRRGMNRSPAVVDVNAGKVPEDDTPVKPVKRNPADYTRITVDLHKGDHRALKREQMQAAEDLNRSRVTTQDVVTALVDLYLTDPDVRQSVVQHLRSPGSQ